MGSGEVFYDLMMYGMPGLAEFKQEPFNPGPPQGGDETPPNPRYARIKGRVTIGAKDDPIRAEFLAVEKVKADEFAANPDMRELLAYNAGVL